MFWSKFISKHASFFFTVSLSWNKYCKYGPKHNKHNNSHKLNNLRLSLLPPPGDEWYLCRLTLTVPSQADLQWAMFPSPYLGAVGPDATPGSVVYRLSARQRDGMLGQAQFFLLDGEYTVFLFFLIIYKNNENKTIQHTWIDPVWPKVCGRPCLCFLVPMQRKTGTDIML